MKLIRGKGNAKSVEGKLYIDGAFECYTVEDTDRKLEKGGVKIQDKTAIPKGKYNVTISMSNRFKKFLPLVEDVIGFSGVRIHSGNSSKDTDGCIIVGSINDRDDDDWVSGSRIAFDRLFPKIKQALSNKQKVTLEIV
ncbi:MAG TPA: DUF5675 family protein [Nitrososphaeraceae archaeon]